MVQSSFKMSTLKGLSQWSIKYSVIQITQNSQTSSTHKKNKIRYTKVLYNLHFYLLKQSKFILEYKRMIFLMHFLSIYRCIIKIRQSTGSVNNKESCLKININISWVLEIHHNMPSLISN